MPEEIAPKLVLVSRAMVELRPLRARFNGLERSFCPHALGRARPGGPLRVFAWQYEGETSGGDDPLPNWRCFALSRLEGLTLEPASWRRGRVTQGYQQTCLTVIEAAVSPQHTSADLRAT